jgi:hypothetical protein
MPLLFSNVVGPCEESGPMIHEIKVTGNAVVGEILKAQVDYWGGTEGASSYQWTRVKDGVRKKTDLQSIDPEVIHNKDIILLPEKDPRCYVVTEDDVGAIFKVSCTPKRQDGIVGEPKTSRPTKAVRLEQEEE